MALFLLPFSEHRPCEVPKNEKRERTIFVYVTGYSILENVEYPYEIFNPDSCLLLAEVSQLPCNV